MADGWRTTFLREQKQVVARKDDITLTREAIALWIFLPQAKEILPSQSCRRFRLMQIALHRELKARGIIVEYYGSTWPSPD